MTEEILVCTAFGLTKEQAAELVDKYGRTKFEEYVKGKITSGDLVSAFVNLDELTTNQKCYLTSHLTHTVMLVQMQIKRQTVLAELLSGGFP